MADYLESEKVRQRWLKYLETGHKEPAERMMATYRRALRQIEAEAKPLIRRLARAERLGEADEAAALSTRLALAYSRAESIREVVRSTVERSGLEGVTDEQIRRLAPKAFAEGARLGYDRLEGVGVQFQRINERAVEQALGRLRRGTNAHEWIQGFAGAQGKEASRSLARSVALGHGVEQMTRDFSRSLSGLAQHRVETFVRTEMIGAMREGNLSTYRANSDLVEGWVWNATGSACAVCQGMNGSVHPITEQMFSHPRCRCSMDPLTRPFSELGVNGATETRSEGFDPNPRFNLLPEREKRRILGPGRYQRWSDGKLDVRDIPARTSNPRWGPGLRSKTLRELDNGGGERVPVTPSGPGPAPPPPKVVDTSGFSGATAPPSASSFNEVLDILAGRHGGDFGVDQGLWDEYWGHKTNWRSGGESERLAAEAFERVLKDMDEKVDDIIEAGRVLEDEVARRLSARGALPDPELVAMRRKNIAAMEAEIRNIEAMPRAAGKKARLRDARIKLREEQGRLAALEEGEHHVVREVLKEVLGDTRPMGLTDEHRLALADLAEANAQSEVLSLMDDMAEFLPTSWLEQMMKWMGDRVSQYGPLEIRMKRRGEFMEGNYGRAPHLWVSTNPSATTLAPGSTTTLHEMTHWAEGALADLRALEWAYYRRRTVVNGVEEKPTSLKAIFPNSGYAQHEKVREDKWANLYTGKDYGNQRESYYEIATMGMEDAMRTRQQPRIDPDHKRFIYGLLAILRRAGA